MRVPPFNYPLQDNLIEKLDLMIKRVTQKNPALDTVLIVEGEEGMGKSTMSVAIAYYVRWKTGRKFDATRVFFDVEELMKFLQNNEKQIVIWDEPAVAALSKDAMTKIVKNLERILMMMRMKRHFFIINMTYFNKFSEYLVWQRPVGMIKVYSPDRIHVGHWAYIHHNDLEKLWRDWRSMRIRNYKKYIQRWYIGRFPNVLNPSYEHNVLSHFDIDLYTKKKEEAIKKIGLDTKEESDGDNTPKIPPSILGMALEVMFGLIKIHPKKVRDAQSKKEFLLEIVRVLKGYGINHYLNHVEYLANYGKQLTEDTLQELIQYLTKKGKNRIPISQVA